MTLRCFLFSSDEGTVANIRQILDSLGVEGEPCSDAVTAAEKITNQSFQIVIIDWDQQPEAGVLLNTARERKAAERPLTLAIISNDPSAPQALQAGANSLLRKPIAMNQAKETLTTARDLLRARQGSAANAQAAAAAASAANVPASSATLRAGEFLQTPTLAPGGQFETEAPVTHSSSSEVNQLKDLEPMAAAVSSESNVPTESQDSAGAFPGLQAMLRGRSAAPQSAPTLPPPAAPRGNPELASFHEISSHPTATPTPSIAKVAPAPAPIQRPAPSSAQDQLKEDRLFAYIQGEREDEEPRAGGGSFKKRAIILASVLAAGAIVAAPQAPWHPKLQTLWKGGRQSIHAWLYPQPVTPVQAPASHENFGRAGDEYKLPVAENIPDSTTDPSQIQVVPVIDPTIKKPQGDAGQPDQSAVPPDTSPIDTPAPPPAVQSPVGQPAVQPPANQALANQPQQSPVVTLTPNVTASVASQPAATTIAATTPSNAPHPDTTTPATTSVPSPVTAPHKYPPQRAPSMPSNVPSSLKSQMASMTPEASGNKAPEAAMQSIEPVLVTEAAERALLSAQSAPVYPPNAKGQQGSVTLQVLVGRDGTVQDAKFMQGSFLFARAAIDSVRQWKFKPYLMNGRPVSVQAPMTIKFSGTQ
jgi:protein TonB